MRISSVFVVPPELDEEVDPRTIEETKLVYREMTTLDMIKHLMVRLYCLNKAIVTRDKIGVVDNFVHVMAIRDLLIPSMEAYRIISGFEQYTKWYLYYLIWGLEPEKTPPEIRELIRTEYQVQIAPYVQRYADPRWVIMALGSILMVI